MKNKYPLKIILAALMLGSFGQAFAATIIDTQNSDSTSTNYVNYFDSSSTAPTRLPFNKDWDWAHNTIAGTFTSATLSITAYDVDSSSDPLVSGEVDNIYAFTSGGDEVWLGSLSGVHMDWRTTQFTLDSSWFDEINSEGGLRIFIDIDANATSACKATGTSECWVVALSQSVLSVETAPVPVPAAAWLLGSGLLGLAGIARRKAA